MNATNGATVDGCRGGVEPGVPIHTGLLVLDPCVARLVAAARFQGSVIEVAGFDIMGSVSRQTSLSLKLLEKGLSFRWAQLLIKI